MGSRFEKFSQHARLVLSLAQEEGHRFNQNYIGTEHILLGLVRNTEGVAARVLSSLLVDLTKVRSGVESIIVRGDQPAQGEIGLTPRVKKVVDLAVDEARWMNHTYIGTEHLLIGLLREGEGVAAGVLESLGVTLDQVLAGTVLVLNVNRLTELPPELWNLTNLDRLNLNGYQLTALPPEIGNLTQLAALDLTGNQLTELPLEIRNLTQLTRLGLRGNQLTELPPEIRNLPKLNQLGLGGNQLTELPAELWNLTQLTVLNLSGNQLTALPPEIGNLTNLTELNLNANQLTELPPEVGNLTNLRSLDMRHNQLKTLTRVIMEFMDRGIGVFSENLYDRRMSN